MPLFTGMPLLYSDNLHCSCQLLVLNHAEFLLRHIVLYPENNFLLRKKFQSLLFEMRSWVPLQ